ncbi:MAG: (deoxy)nucleoside triphosphate pyrophosphohydrolase [Flavobacterium sp.]
MKENSIVDVTCALIYLGNKILVTQRSENMKLPLKWEFPGGKLEENESKADCIKREILEEINIEIEVVKQLSNSVYDYGSFKINLIPFIANYVSGEIILSEHKDYKLLDKAELLNLDWAEADLPIVEEFLKLEL